MKLTSMRLSKKESKEELGLPEKTAAADGPRYPYELRIRLDNEIIDKLKLNTDHYNVGDKCRIEAVGEVIGIEVRQRQGGEDRENLEIQIVEFALEPDKKERKEKARAKHLDEIGASHRAEPAAA